MNELDTLKFNLSKKEKELAEISLTTFTLNKNIEKLVNEITTIKNQIKELEEKENG